LLFSQEHPAYNDLQNQLKTGWNTWSTYSMGQHVLLPSGAALNLGLHKSSKNTDGFVNRFFVDKTANGLRSPIVKPGYHSYSGDYSSMEVTYQKVRLRIESAAYDNDLYLLITPLELDEEYKATLIVEGGLLWNKPGQVSRVEDALTIKTPDQKLEFRSSAPPSTHPFFNTLSPFLAIDLNGPVGISNAHSTIEVIQHKVSEKRAEYKAYLEQYGELSEAYAGMAAGLAWNTIYDPVHDRVFSTVDRQWNINRGGYVFFGWDNFFMAHMIGLDAPELAMANAIEALREATADGFISNLSQGNGRKAWDRSQPPVGGLACWDIYEKHGQKWFLETTYPRLLRWNKWWLENRLNGDLLSWGSNPAQNPFHDKVYHNLHAAMLETGIDDSPMYLDVQFNPEKNVMEMHDVGLNAMYIADCQVLAKMAKALGKTDDAQRLRKRAERFQQNLQALWKEDNQLFQNYDLVKKSFSERISPTSFYPLLAGTATSEQAQAMVRQHLLNEAEFWGQWVLPSISKSDPLYPKQRYWKGAIWAPMNFLVYLGMREYPELSEARRDLADKSVELFLRNWQSHGFVCENYSPIDGTCTEPQLTSSPWYTWGGLLALIGLMEEGFYD
jgi:neutral trehalase